MNRRTLVAVLAGAAVAVVAAVPAAQGVNGHANYHAVCPGPPAGYGHCHALVSTDRQGKPQAGTAPTGLSPATIASVYGFSTSSTAGSGKTIAIVDAYDDPTAESDLGTFSAQYGLPACTTANGCFTKVNQTGGTSYPSTDPGWALEISLDVQWAHAIAPGAHILLVEASSSSFLNLLTAEDYAKAHAQYVSNSWGASEFSGETSYDSHFSQSGVSFFVSAGDNGLPAEYPSASPNVISVGGTTLHFDGSGNYTGETGWSSGGGGCSTYENATSAQTGFSGYSQVSCGGRRATPDVSLDADPNSGVSVYDSTAYSGQTGWWKVGGTSASSPMWAARSADEGAVVNSAYVYGSSITFRDITSGNNGAPCLVGFDLCTGRGSWLGGSGSPSPTISFSGGPQSLTAGIPSAQMHVTLSSPAASTVTITLLSSSPGGTFSPTSVSVSADGTTSGGFTYTDTKAGSPTLTATAPGYTSGTQTETVGAGPLASITVSPASATVPVGGKQQFSAAGADAYQNAVSISPAWTTDVAGGSVSSTGLFTAGTGLDSGHVLATVGNIRGSADVWVTGLAAPTNLTASAKPRRINLAWLGSGSGVTYSVYRGTTSGGETLLRSGVSGTSYTDSAVSSRVTYFYYVVAVSGSSQSGHSNEVSVKAR